MADSTAVVDIGTKVRTWWNGTEKVTVAVQLIGRTRGWTPITSQLPGVPKVECEWHEDGSSGSNYADQKPLSG